METSFIDLVYRIGGMIEPQDEVDALNEFLFDVEGDSLAEQATIVVSRLTHDDPLYRMGILKDAFIEVMNGYTPEEDLLLAASKVNRVFWGWELFFFGPAHESIVSAIEQRKGLAENLGRLESGKWDYKDTKALLSATTRLVIELERRGDRIDHCRVLDRVGAIFSTAPYEGLDEEDYLAIKWVFLSEIPTR